MRRERGITLVSLVVTIIILIILASVSINLTLGENGIITKAKQAKENIDLAQIEEQIALNELYTQIELENGNLEIGNLGDDTEKINSFKKSIADYIEEAGGIKPEYTADIATFGESIKGIVTEVTKDATATAEDIAVGKTAWIKGKLVTGNASSSLSNIKTGTFTATLSEWYNVELEFKPDFVFLISPNISMEYVAELSNTQYRCCIAAGSEYVKLGTLPTWGYMNFDITDDGFKYFRSYNTDLECYYIAGKM